MTVTSGLLLGLWLFSIPLGMGAIPAVFVDKKHYSPGFMWTTGYILMWAMFQVICVPFILTETVYAGRFPQVVAVFGTVSGLFAVAGVALWTIRYKKGILGKFEKGPVSGKSGKEVVFWVLCILLIGLQLVLSVAMNYADGDDAFYVAVSSLTEDKNTMYKANPYSVGNTDLNMRHGLAPFPIWITFLARISGAHTTVVAQTVVSTILILLTYVLFAQIGKILFAEKKEGLPLFLSFTALLVIFGDYSIYTVENFMIARSRQGKAALGNIIIPMVIFLFLLLFERIRREQKIELMLWVLLTATVTAACLCSTLGTFLMCLFLGVIGLCAGIVYRKWSLIWKTAICCLPALVFAALYFMIG